MSRMTLPLVSVIVWLTTPSVYAQTSDVEDLLKALGSPEHQLEAADAICNRGFPSKRPEDVEILLRIYLRASPAVRVTLIRSIGSLSGNAVGPIKTLYYSKERTREEKRNLVGIIGHLDGPACRQVESVMTNFLLSSDCTNDDVLLAGNFFLATKSAATPTLLLALDGSIGRRRVLVTELLAKFIKPTEVNGQIRDQLISKMVSGMESEDPELKIASVKVLGALHITDNKTLESMAVLSRDNDPFVRQAMVVALGRIGSKSPSVIAALKVLLNDKLEFCVDSALLTVAQLKIQDNLVEDLVMLAESKHSCVTRCLAINEIANLTKPSKQAINTLEQQLKDPNATIRLSAAQSLLAISRNHQNALSIVFESITNQDVNVRLQAIQLIGSRMPSHSKTEKALLDSLQDEDLIVCVRVALSLWKQHRNTPTVRQKLEAAIQRCAHVEAKAVYAGLLMLFDQKNKDAKGTIEEMWWVFEILASDLDPEIRAFALEVLRSPGFADLKRNDKIGK